MMIFIRWLKTDDEKFRAAYLEKTKTPELPEGEKIQATALEEENGLYYMVSSWRVTDKQLTELKDDRAVTTKKGDLKTGAVWPSDWITKEPEQ